MASKQSGIYLGCVQQSLINGQWGFMKVRQAKKRFFVIKKIDGKKTFKQYWVGI